jgi:hypothetical protein
MLNFSDRPVQIINLLAAKNKCAQKRPVIKIQRINYHKTGRAAN